MEREGIKETQSLCHVSFGCSAGGSGTTSNTINTLDKNNNVRGKCWGFCMYHRCLVYVCVWVVGCGVRNTDTLGALSFSKLFGQAFVEMKLINRGKRIRREIFCGQQLLINFWENGGCVECQKCVPGCKSCWWKLRGLCENKQNCPNYDKNHFPCFIQILLSFPNTPIFLIHCSHKSARSYEFSWAWRLSVLDSHTIRQLTAHPSTGNVNSEVGTSRETVLGFPQELSMGVFEHLPTYTLQVIGQEYQLSPWNLM